MSIILVIGEDQIMDRELFSVEEIFPGLEPARLLLRDLIDGTNGFQVTIYEETINIAVNFPINILKKIPSKYVSTIKELCFDVLKSRITDDLIGKWSILPISNRSLEEVRKDLDNSEKIRISKGHPSLKEDLSIKFGLFRDYYKFKWNLK